ncbi:large ribosomal subunit protein uL15m [Diutina catenulata]
MFGLSTQWASSRVVQASTPSVFARVMSHMSQLSPNEGSTFTYKRLGRGPASKGGKSGRGQKGQKARGKVPHWLEGGQTPYYKRFPIVGFSRAHRRELNDINLERIQEFWDAGRIPLAAGETLTIRVMRECGLLTGSLADGVKILGVGKENYNVPLKIEANRASEPAIAAIEAAGGSFTAQYFTKLSLQAHVFPERYELKKGYVPMAARPTHRRDIEYYTNPDKRGYLLQRRELLLDHMKDPSATQARTSKKRTALMQQLDTASQQPVAAAHRVVSVDDL